MKVADITDNAVLDRLVAECRKWLPVPLDQTVGWIDVDDNLMYDNWVDMYEPTINRAQWAELVEEFKIELYRPDDADPNWEAEAEWMDEKVQLLNCYTAVGPTPGIAVCKAFIVSVKGEEVEL